MFLVCFHLWELMKPLSVRSASPNYAEQCDGCLQLLAPAQDSGEHQATQLFLF